MPNHSAVVTRARPLERSEPLSRCLDPPSPCQGRAAFRFHRRRGGGLECDGVVGALYGLPSLVGHSDIRLFKAGSITQYSSGNSGGGLAFGMEKDCGARVAICRC
jgi:hypothetical protein